MFGNNDNKNTYDSSYNTTSGNNSYEQGGQGYGQKPSAMEKVKEGVMSGVDKIKDKMGGHKHDSSSNAAYNSSSDTYNPQGGNTYSGGASGGNTYSGAGVDRLDNTAYGTDNNRYDSGNTYSSGANTYSSGTGNNSTYGTGVAGSGGANTYSGGGTGGFTSSDGFGNSGMAGGQGGMLGGQGGAYNSGLGNDRSSY